MRVCLYATFRPIVGARRVELDLPDGTTVLELAGELAGRWPELREHLLTDAGDLSRRVNVFVDGRNVRWLEKGAHTRLPADAEVDFFPPVAGG